MSRAQRPFYFLGDIAIGPLPNFGSKCEWSNWHESGFMWMVKLTWTWSKSNDLFSSDWSPDDLPNILLKNVMGFIGISDDSIFGRFLLASNLHLNRNTLIIWYGKNKLALNLSKGIRLFTENLFPAIVWYHDGRPLTIFPSFKDRGMRFDSKHWVGFHCTDVTLWGAWAALNLPPKYCLNAEKQLPQHECQVETTSHVAMRY